MNCSQVEDLLIEYVYGELPADQARSVEVHLTECPACARIAAELEWVRELAASSPDPEPSRMTVNRILAHAREEAERPKPLWGLGWAKVLAPLSVMVVVGGLVFYQFQSGYLSDKTLVGPAPVEHTPVATAPEPVPDMEESVSEVPVAEAPAEEPAPPPPPSESPVEADADSPKPVLRGGAPSTLMPTATPAKPKPGSAGTGAPTSAAVMDKAAEGTGTPPSPSRELAFRSAVPKPAAKTKAGRSEAEPELKLDRLLPADSKDQPHTATAEDAGSAALTPDVPEKAVARSRTTRDLVIEDEQKEVAKKKPQPAPIPDTVKAVPAGPEYTTELAARLMEGRRALDSGQYHRAGEVFRTVLHSLPPGHQDRPKTLLWLARAYEGLGYPDKALETYRLLAEESEDHRELAQRKIEELTQP